MRQLFTLVFCAIGSFLFAQSNFTVFNNDGQQFYVIMNGIKQNSVPQTNVSVSGVKNGGYSVKVIFADGKTPDINKNFMIDAPMDITTRVVFKKGQGKLQLVSMQPTAGSVVNGAVIYRQDNNVIYSDAPIVNVQSPPSNTTINTTQTIPSNVNGNVQVNGTQTQTQTNMNTSNQNMNGNVNMNVGMNGNVGVNGTTSTNGQNGNVNMNTNVGSNGMNISVNDPISGENINMNLNVGFNTNGTDMTVSDPMMNGMPITNSTSTSTVTTTSSQTINGQTNYQSGSTTTQNNNGNVTVTTTGTPTMNGNVNMTTNMNTNPNTNGNVTVTTTGTPNMNGNVNMNTSSTMNGNGNTNSNVNGNTNVNSTNTINTSQNTNTTSTVVTNGNFINCTRMLLNTDEFIADLKTQKFEDNRVEIINKDLVNTCVTSAQVYKILETITFEATKYEVAQFLYFRTSDRQLLDKGMLPLFIYDSTKMDWREFVRKNL
jgi:hypothetical protein